MHNPLAVRANRDRHGQGKSDAAKARLEAIGTVHSGKPGDTFRIGKTWYEVNIHGSFVKLNYDPTHTSAQ